MTTTIEHTVKVGDLFIESWGYDQTNVDVYEVVRITPKSVALMKGYSRMLNGRVLPVAGHSVPFTDYCRIGTPNKEGEVIKRVLGGSRHGPYLNMSSYSGAWIWDGTSTFYDTIAAGHPGH